MASTRLLITLIVIMSVFIQTVFTKDFVVGDDKGWTTNVDYEAWGQGKDFRVGDKLIFKYAKGAHNLFKVDASGYLHCVAPPANEALTSGYDVINLTTSGFKWYICGVPEHCEQGNQKLGFVVYPLSVESSPASSPTDGGTLGSPPASTASVVTASMMVAVFGLLILLVL